MPEITAPATATILEKDMSKYTAEQVQKIRAAHYEYMREYNAKPDAAVLSVLDDFAVLLRERESAKAMVTDDLNYVPGELDRTAPVRIWLQIDTVASSNDREEPWPRCDDVTWQDESIGGLEIQYVRADLVVPVLASDALPIPMILHCPSCGVQHIDAPDDTVSVHMDGRETVWDKAKFENWWLRNGDPFDLHKVAAWETWQAAYASRDAEVEELRKDAERYRKMREIAFEYAGGNTLDWNR